MDNIFKVICTGNPNYPGIANSILKEFPDTKFISLSNGYDLTTTEGQTKFKNIIKEYNVFVNVSRISNGIQEKLLRITHQEWNRGHVFNIGSIAEYKRWEWYDPEYSKEKINLKEASLELLSEKFKTTHITVGGFQDYANSDPARLNPDEIVKIIKYVLQCSINIPVVGIEKIQGESDGKL